jgi:sugar phosphate isomerase/epimerase
MKGPAIFLAQFAGDTAPFDSLDNMCAWAADLGYKGIQLPTWVDFIIDLEKAATSQTYCDELKGKIAAHGLEITELSTHLQGQLVAVHPAYDIMFDAFAPEAYRNNPKARTEWAVQQCIWAAQASAKLGLSAHVTFPGALVWPYMYPWPQRPAGLVEAGFTELAKRWKPILDAHEDNNVYACYEIHPGEDIHDGHTFEMFLEYTKNHPKVAINYDPSHFVLQQLDYLQFIDFYHPYIKAYHVKDAEFNPTGKSGVYGGYQPWIDRAGRFRSLGDGETDFSQIFSKLTQYGYDSWAVLEWECCIKDGEQGAREGAMFIEEHLIKQTEKAFDDFAGSETDDEINKKILGI